MEIGSVISKTPLLKAAHGNFYEFLKLVRMFILKIPWDGQAYIMPYIMRK